MNDSNANDPGKTGQAEDSLQRLQQSLRVALQDLIAHTGSDGFLARLGTDSGETFYLAFGKFETLREMIVERPATEADLDIPTIH